MTLSYTLRLVCVLTIAAGLVLAASQLALAMAARPILLRLDALTARWRERILYLIQIGPAILAVFIAAALCLPAYLRSETNLATESVSLLCLLLTAVIAVWFGSALLRSFRITLRTLRFARACRRSGQVVSHAGDILIVAMPHAFPPIGLLGFRRPLILVSPHFLGASTLTPAALDLALAHERSHALHRDNWKLLTVSFLPRVDRLLPLGNPWEPAWLLASDCAADDDAVRNDPARSLLLAEALVAGARAVADLRPPQPPLLCTALISAEAGLAARVDRLLHPQLDVRPSRSSLLCGLIALALLAAAAIGTLSPWIYSVSERLLHLGQACSPH